MFRSFILIVIVCFFEGCKDKNINPKIFYYGDQKIRAIKYFKDGLLDGECFWYYANSNLKEKLQYKKGNLDGHAYFFYENGALKSHKFYKGGKNIGYMADYFDDTVGNVKSVLLYNNDGKLIYLKEFDRDGNVIKESGKKSE